MYTLDKVLKDSVAAHASDIHFTVGCSPFFRIDGMLIPQEGEKLMPKDMEELLLPILDQRHRKELEENGQTDLAYAIRGVGRFRVSIFKQRGTLASVMRCLPVYYTGSQKPRYSGGGTGTDSETAGARSGNRTDGKRQVYDTGIFGGYYQPHVSVSYYYIGGSD